MSVSLQSKLEDISPRFTQPATPFSSWIIHTSVASLWLILLLQVFLGRGISAWTIGIVYIVYDTLLILFTFKQTFRLRHGLPFSNFKGARPTLTVIVAAYNESAILESTIIALFQQSEPPEQIIVADDGSTDKTPDLLYNRFGLPQIALNEISPLGRLRWFRGKHLGKAATLNAVIPYIETDLLVTVDADTALDIDAIEAMKDGFHADPNLVAATGVLTPACGSSWSGKFFEWFQTYEYIRNFLGRYAWGRKDSLLLISGAFAGFRRDAVIAVGGFDTDCIVEDYEMIHRLRRYGYNNHLNWHSDVLGKARAETSAPATLLSFLRQRRRWFGGFLQTHCWYRDMVGSKQYQNLGRLMLPVKAIDTLQPVYGICAFIALVAFVVTGKFNIAGPVLLLIFGKLLIDIAFHIWSVDIYRRWSGGRIKTNIILAILASLAEPFSFQILRHLGACWGWVAFLTGQRIWGVQKRPVGKERIS